MTRSTGGPVSIVAGRVVGTAAGTGERSIRTVLRATSTLQRTCVEGGAGATTAGFVIRVQPWFATALTSVDRSRQQSPREALCVRRQQSGEATSDWSAAAE